MKEYTLKVIEDDKGFHFESTSDGFNALEVLGILETKKKDIFKQMEGSIKPKYFKRSIIDD